MTVLQDELSVAVRDREALLVARSRQWAERRRVEHGVAGHNIVLLWPHRTHNEMLTHVVIDGGLWATGTHTPRCGARRVIFNLGGYFHAATSPLAAATRRTHVRCHSPSRTTTHTLLHT